MAGIKICIVTMILTVMYIFFTVLLSNLFFYNKANGSLIKINNKIIGSRLIGQEFKNSIYFHGRFSLNNYKNDISGNSNFPYYSEESATKLKHVYHDYLIKNYGTKPDLNLITESASGLDPHITYNGAIAQLDRISHTGGLTKDKIIELINKKSKGYIFGLLGEKIINVLELNIELSNHYDKKT